MIVKVGDTVASEFANPAIVVAITKEWVIYKNSKGVEFCSNKADCDFWIPAEIEWEDSI